MLDEYDDKDETNETSAVSNQTEIFTPLTFDPTPYLHHLAESDLTEAQKHGLRFDLRASRIY